MTTFGKYSFYYDLLYKDKNYILEAEYIDKLIKKYRPETTSILDLGCGTGKHACLLADKGYNVHGVDVSETMLSIAATYVTNKDKSTFSLGDIRTIRLEKKFDIVISLFHVMSYQTSNHDLNETINTAYTHLKPDGIYIFDCWYGPAVLTTLPEIRMKRIADGKLSIIRLAEPVLDINNNIVNVNYNIIMQDKLSNKLDEIKESHKMRYLFLPEVDFLLQQNGFELQDHFEFMTGINLSKNTWSACFVSKRSGK